MVTQKKEGRGLASFNYRFKLPAHCFEIKKIFVNIEAWKMERPASAFEGAARGKAIVIDVSSSAVPAVRVHFESWSGNQLSHSIVIVIKFLCSVTVTLFTFLSLSFFLLLFPSGSVDAARRFSFRFYFLVILFFFWRSTWPSAVPAAIDGRPEETVHQVREGADLDLLCLASGRPVPRVSWIRQVSATFRAGSKKC